VPGYLSTTTSGDKFSVGNAAFDQIGFLRRAPAKTCALAPLPGRQPYSAGCNGMHLTTGRAGGMLSISRGGFGDVSSTVTCIKRAVQRGHGVLSGARGKCTRGEGCGRQRSQFGSSALLRKLLLLGAVLSCSGNSAATAVSRSRSANCSLLRFSKDARTGPKLKHAEGLLQKMAESRIRFWLHQRACICKARIALAGKLSPPVLAGYKHHREESIDSAMNRIDIRFATRCVVLKTHLIKKVAALHGTFRPSAAQLFHRGCNLGPIHPITRAAKLRRRQSQSNRTGDDPDWRATWNAPAFKPLPQMHSPVGRPTGNHLHTVARFEREDINCGAGREWILAQASRAKTRAPTSSIRPPGGETSRLRRNQNRRTCGTVIMGRSFYRHGSQSVRKTRSTPGPA